MMKYWHIFLFRFLAGLIVGALVAFAYFSLPPIPAVTTSTLTSAHTHPVCVPGDTRPCTQNNTVRDSDTTEVDPPKAIPVISSSFNKPNTLAIGQQATFLDGLMVTARTIEGKQCQEEAGCLQAVGLAPELTLTGGELGTAVVSITLGPDRTLTTDIGHYTLDLSNTSVGHLTFTITNNKVNTTVLKSVTKTQQTAASTVTSNLTPAPTLTTTPAPRPRTDFAEEVRTLVIAATNKFRISQSLPKLTTDNALKASAQTYSARLQAGGYLAHIDKKGCDLTCRFTESGYQAQSWGENLAMMEYDEQPSAEYVATFFMTQWEKSAGHRANLLSPTFTRQGIGVTVGTSDIYVVVHFALPSTSSVPN